MEQKKLSQLQLAHDIAERAHAGQIDKSGRPVLEHPEAVAELCTTETEKSVALLHDVVEDTDWTLDDLRMWGVDEEIVAAVDCLTRRKGEKIGKYLDRVASNLTAAEVKDFDMFDNMNYRRNNKFSEQKCRATIKKYERRRIMLADRILPPHENLKD